MGQPIKLYKGSETITAYGPAELRKLLAGGWSTEKPEPAKPKTAAKRTTKKTAGGK